MVLLAAAAAAAAVIPLFGVNSCAPVLRPDLLAAEVSVRVAIRERMVAGEGRRFRTLEAVAVPLSRSTANRRFPGPTPTSGVISNRISFGVIRKRHMVCAEDQCRRRLLRGRTEEEAAAVAAMLRGPKFNHVPLLLLLPLLEATVVVPPILPPPIGAIKSPILLLDLLVLLAP